MKKLQNNFTTPEQSKRLLELGVPADSADCYYGSFGRLGWRNEQTLRDGFFAEYRSYTPCWSVGRLMEIFDMCCINEQSSNVGWCLYRKLYEPFIYAGDVDYLCCKMVLLNLCLNSARGEVRHGNALTADEYGVWHLDRLWLNGYWVSWVWYYDKQTDMEALNSERQRQLDDIYMYGGFLDLGTDEERSEPVPPSEPPAQPATEPVQAASSPQAVEPLQLSLF